MDATAVGDAAIITAPTSMSMRVAIELRQMTGHPVALTEDGKLVGVCGDEEIYRGILRQTGIADRPVDQSSLDRRATAGADAPAD